MLDDSITDLTDQHDQSRWRVVVLGALPNEQDRVHDWHEQEVKLREVVACHQLIKPLFQDGHEREGVVGLNLGLLDLFLQLFEWLVVGRLRLKKELQDLLDLLGLELLMD